MDVQMVQWWMANRAAVAILVNVLPNCWDGKSLAGLGMSEPTLTPYEPTRRICLRSCWPPLHDVSWTS
jgi:hypothetical protein